MDSAPLKQRALEEIDRTADELVDLCARIVRVPAENPPGDTSQVADFILDLLDGYGVRGRRYEPRPGMVSVVFQIGNPQEKPHLVFNAHLDEFPAEHPDSWAFPPYGGQVADGQIRGRGAADMRGGLTASLYAFLLLHRFGLPARGCCTLMLVADEECGGYWGAGWLVRTFPELLGDALIIGEPDSPESLRIGQKGKSQLRLVARGEPYGAALATLNDANTRLGSALPLLRDLLEVRGPWPEEVQEVLAEARDYAWTDRGAGMQWLLERTAVNVGVIRGGIKINIVPSECVAEVDVRIPYGVKPADIKARVERVLAEAGLADITVEHIEPTFQATYTSPKHPFVQTVRRNIREVTGRDPRLTVGFGSNDARYFMPHGVPAVIYGPRPYNIAAANEYITIEDLITATKVHAGAAFDFLCG
ncbi:MAG: M20/M25/M40 family metallo-hydrolase [Armatimonadetes bacterium]|nr:M20/M25/M40 family metallo-hydrolase [Armatimonadota bacterium]